MVERGNLTIVGRFFNENNLNFVVPDDQRIGQDVFILPEHTKGAESGQVVSVKITKHPTKHYQPVGEIDEVLGDYLAPGMEIEIAIRKHQLPHHWPDAVEQQIAAFSEDVSEKDFEGVRISETCLWLRSTEKMRAILTMLFFAKHWKMVEAGLLSQSLMYRLM